LNETVAGPVIEDMMPIKHAYTIVTVHLDSGEVVPILVESSTWMPARLVTRWALTHRRLRSASKTLNHNLFTLKIVYCWARSRGIDLDELLLAEGSLDRGHIKSLITEIQDFRAKRTRARVLSTLEKGPNKESSDSRRNVAEAEIAVPIDQDIAALENFFSWAADPFNTGVKPSDHQKAVSIWHLNSTRAAIREVLNAYKIGTSYSNRLEPLSLEELNSLHHYIAPVRASTRKAPVEGLFPRTPWTLATCLRNWLMFCLAEQCGLRIGEILKLTLEDVGSLTPGGSLTIQVRRRPDDPLDARKHPPAVKTLERVLEASPEIAWGLRLYLTLRPPLGRVRGKTPYLFVTESGDPLSYASAHRAIQVLGKHAGIERLCWHRLRHTWAELLAKELLQFSGEGVGQKAIEKLRYLGGWSEKSSTPFHYIRNAIRESANEFLRKRNERMYQ
jgi:integrase